MKNRHFCLRFVSVLLVALMLLPLLAACGNTLEENEIAVTWHMGRVTSHKNKQNKEMLLDGVENYSYSDPILIEKAGTTLTFFDDNGKKMPDTEYADGETYVISHWVEKDGAWVLQTPGDHYEGGFLGRGAEISTADGDSVLYTYTTTYDNEVIRLCYRSGQTEENGKKFKFPKVCLENLKEDGTLFKNEKQKDKLEREWWLALSKEEFYANVLEGKTVLCIGDSYMDDSSIGTGNMWIELLRDKYNMTLYNHAVSGSTVARTDSVQPDKAVEYFSPMVNRLTNPLAKKTLFGTTFTPDIIFFDGGRNDFNPAQGNVPLGTLYVNNDVNQGLNYDVHTFYGAVNTLLRDLKEKYPNALIIGMTCWSVQRSRTGSNAATQLDFANAMLSACEANGVPCLNNADKVATGVDMDDALFRAKYCKKSDDISHLNKDGMKKYFPVVEAFAAAAYSAHLAA